MQSPLLTLHDPANARRYYAAGLWRDETLYGLLERHAAERPDDFALRDGRTRLTWSALRRLVDAVAGDLHAAGLKRGERVAVWLPNRVEAVAVFLACSRQGYVCNPSLHQNYTVAEIVELLARTRAAALFAQPGYGADARTADIFAAAAELPSLRRVYSLGENHRGRRRAVPRPRQTSADIAAARDEPGLGRLSRLHLGHDRDAERRHAFRQHAARQRARDGRGLGSRSSARSC